MINTMTPRQQSFVADMLAEIFAGQPAGTAESILARNIDRGLFCDRAATKASIDALIVKRDAARADRRAAGRAVGSAPVTVAPAGYYAVDYAGALRFYRIVAGKGRHEGRTFVNRFKSDDETFVSRREYAAVMALIVADIEAAAMRFVNESKHCRMCGRRLTDLPTALGNRGYGPECVKKV